MLVMVLGGCAVLRPILDEHLSDRATAVELAATPFHPQEAYQCGPAALATVLNVAGVPVSPDALVEQTYLPAREGSLQAELIAAARRYDRLGYVVGPEPADLLAQLVAARPVLVLQNLGLVRDPVWHYAVVVGFDAERDHLILRSGLTERAILPASRFLRTWERAGSWGLVILRPGEMPARPDQGRYLEAAAGLEAAGRHAAAGLAYRGALEHWPDALPARFGLANTLYAQGDYLAAEAQYRRLLESSPEHPAAHHNLALTLARRGCLESAGVQLEVGRVLAPQELKSAFDRSRNLIAELYLQPAAELPACTPARSN